MAVACTTWLPDSDDEFRLSKCQSLSPARLTILFKLTGTVLTWVSVLVMPLRLSNSILSWITNNILFLYRKENASMQGHFDNCKHQIYLTVFCWTDISLTTYSYFEKGCRKKCTRQSRKVLWVVLCLLFFKEIWKNVRRGHGSMFASAKGKQQK